MIWALIRIFLFIGLIGLITISASYVIESSNTILIQFAGVEIAIHPISALFGVFLFVLLIWGIEWLIGICRAVFHFFNGDETAISRYFKKGREKRGYKALEDVLCALACGEGQIALEKAASAERYLNHPQITNLLNAQAANAAGDSKRAIKYNKRLLNNEKTRFVGLQGLLREKYHQGEHEVALKLAQKAHELRPKHDGTLNTLFALQTAQKDWQGAQKTVQAHIRAGHLKRDIGKRREAALALEEARTLLEQGDIQAGKAAAFKANKSAPALVPAAVLAAEMHMLYANKRAAAKILRNAWSANPHPDIPTAYAEIEPNETSAQRLKRFAPLLKLNPNHSETKLLHTELCISTEDFPQARRVLGDLAQQEPTQRPLTLMAAIERGSGADDKTVRAWLNKALMAPRGAQWVCESCKQIHQHWNAICHNCDGFDTLDWRDMPVEQGNTSPMLEFTAGLLTADDDKKTDTDDD